MKYLMFLLFVMSCSDNVTITHQPTCTVDSIRITCPDGTSTLLPQPINGTDGKNGEIGATGLQGPAGLDGLPAPITPYTPVALIDPCGDAPGIYDEVFIKMSNGQVIASFSNNVNGDYTRFSVLVPGTYTTTDADSCSFSIDINGNITNENHHY